MSYEGFREHLCTNGHYSECDCYDRITQCPVEGCGAEIQYEHGVDTTNGYDERHSDTCRAPKTESGFEDRWHTDHYGNRYATKVMRFEPAGNGIWINVAIRRQRDEELQARAAARRRYVVYMEILGDDAVTSYLTEYDPVEATYKFDEQASIEDAVLFTTSEAAQMALESIVSSAAAMPHYQSILRRFCGTMITNNNSLRDDGT